MPFPLLGTPFGESDFELFFHHALVGMAQVDVATRRILVANARLAQMLGYSVEELQQKTVDDITHPEDIAEDRQRCADMRAGERPSATTEKRYVRGDGGVVWARVSVNVFRDADGRPARTVSMIEDITAAKREEAERRAHAEQFRTLADEIAQLCWIAEPDGRTSWFNRRWNEYTGLSSDELANDGWRLILEPHEVPRMIARWEEAVAHGTAIESTLRLRGADGRFRWFLIRVVPLRDADGRITRWFGTNTDIDAQRRTEEGLTRAVEMRDEFLSIASHELRTPLTSLQLQVQLLSLLLRRDERGALTAAQLRGAVELTERQVLRLGRLVDDMLDISRITTDRLELRREKVALAALVDEVVSRIRPQLDLAGGTVSVEVAPDLSGDWDPARLEQVLTNLLTNAMRYGAGRPVDIAAARRDDVVLITVRDRGIGIAREDHERIFGRFERAISANEVSGLGLGLFITREIVRAHGGRIWVESEPGQGATFFVELPAAAS